MTFQAESIKQAVEEVEFQILSTLDVCNWVAAIARAIVRDVETGGGLDVPVLTDLAKHFDDTGAGNLSVAFEQFRQISILHSAPQNAESKNVARNYDGLPTFAERIKLVREEAGLTQAELAKACGVSQANIAQLECGNVGRTSYLAEIARACGASTDWLAFGDVARESEVKP